MLKPIKSGKIYELIIEEISELIEETELQPGDKIPSEREISNKLAVSRASVRQAISALVAKGILEVKQGDGTYVAGKKISKDSLLSELSENLASQQISPVEITEVRLLLECETARLCAQRITDEQKQRLMAISYRENNFNEKIDTRYKINQELHSLITEGAENTVLKILLDNVFQLMNGNMWRWAKAQGSHDKKYSLELHIKQHEAIISAILNNNPDTAERIMKQHIKNIDEEMNVLFNEKKNS